MHLRLVLSSVTILWKASLLKLLRSFEENTSVCKSSKTRLPSRGKETQILSYDHVNRTNWGRISHSSKFEY